MNLPSVPTVKSVPASVANPVATSFQVYLSPLTDVASTPACLIVPVTLSVFPHATEVGKSLSNFTVQASPAV